MTKRAGTLAPWEKPTRGFPVRMVVQFVAVIGFLPALGIIALTIIRTGLEDRTLQKELPGYAAYARRTRFRLLPGVW